MLTHQPVITFVSRDPSGDIRPVDDIHACSLEGLRAAWGVRCLIVDVYAPAGDQRVCGIDVAPNHASISRWLDDYIAERYSRHLGTSPVALARFSPQAGGWQEEKIEACMSEEEAKYLRMKIRAFFGAPIVCD